MAALSLRGIQAAADSPIPLPLQPAFAGLRHDEGTLPQEELAAREVVSLPVYPEVTAARVESVAGAIHHFPPGQRFQVAKSEDAPPAHERLRWAVA